MARRLGTFKEKWRRFRTSSRFHNVLMFLVFVAVAAVLWLVSALNDNVAETFRVKLVFRNVPDSVTFINDPPSEIHVTVRDKGTNIIRSGVLKNPLVDFNFSDYARDGILRITRADFNSELKADFGGAAQISSVSIDSLKLYYTNRPGKRVPVIVNAKVSAASGFIISGSPVPVTKSVRVFSYGDEIDTVTTVRTQMLIRKSLSQTSDFEVKLQPLAHVKIVPSVVKVRIPVEPLVHKEAYVPVEVRNLPPGESLLLFPDKVPVVFYVPMSHFNDDSFPMRVEADYLETMRTSGSKISVKVASHDPVLVNVELKVDSVDYTLVKH